MTACETRPSAGDAPANGADLPLAAEFLRYLVVGGVALVADFGALALLTNGCGWHYLQSAAIAFGIGMAVTYVLSVRWVFKFRAVKNPRLEFLFFALIGLAGLGINQLLLWTLTDGLGIHYLQSKLVTTAVVLGWNFAARKLLLFGTPPSPAEDARMPFNAAWDHLVTHLRQLSVDAIILSVEDADGGLAGQSWSNVDARLAASSIEIMHRSRRAHCCRLRIESMRPIAAGEWSRLVGIVDRFAEFWATHPETVPTTSLELSVESPPRLPLLENHPHLCEKRIA